MKNLIKSLLVIFTFASTAQAEDAYLIGGKVTTSREIVRLNNGTCTGAIVGPRTVLTAGHCFATGKKISFHLDGMTVTGTCVRNPDYSGWLGVKNDHSICFTDSVMKKPHAYIDVRPVQKGEQVQLAGYGCYTSRKDNDGQLRAGLAPITSINSQNFVTIGTTALCFGDSGGSVFRYGQGYADVANKTKGVLVTVGINSQGNIKDTSYLAVLSSDSFARFAASYIGKYKTEVCGLTKCE